MGAMLSTENNSAWLLCGNEKRSVMKAPKATTILSINSAAGRCRYWRARMVVVARSPNHICNIVTRSPENITSECPLEKGTKRDVFSELALVRLQNGGGSSPVVRHSSK